MFLFYENINKVSKLFELSTIPFLLKFPLQNLKETIKIVADFLGKTLTPDQLQQLEDHLRFDNFKKNEAVNNTLERDLGLQNPNEQSYIRNGKICDWEGYFTEEMNSEADLWIENNLKLVNMKFPL